MFQWSPTKGKMAPIETQWCGMWNRGLSEMQWLGKKTKLQLSIWTQQPKSFLLSEQTWTRDIWVGNMEYRSKPDIYTISDYHSLLKTLVSMFQKDVKLLKEVESRATSEVNTEHFTNWKLIYLMWYNDNLQAPTRKKDFNSRVIQSFGNGQNKIQQKLKPANSEQK